MSKPIVLTIAGSDPSGGAGIQADLKTFAAHDVHGASAITVVTAQNAQRFETLPVPAAFITAQIDAVFEQYDVRAIKIGMLANEDAVYAIINALEKHNRQVRIPVVLDPVIRASNGGLALDRDGIGLMREFLLPYVSLIKPNIFEAAELLLEPEAVTIEQMSEQAIRLEQQFAGPDVLLSGGHLAGSEAVDILSVDGEIHTFSAKKLEKGDIHGTGCTLTSSIAAHLAKGHGVVEAVKLAKNYLAGLMRVKPVLDRAGNPGSLNHLALRSDKSGN